jgi:hypothetical protein
MTVRIRYRVDPAALAGANLGIDPEASAARYAERLRQALEVELAGLGDLPSAPELRIELGTPKGCVLEGAGAMDRDRADGLRLRVDGVAKAVRDCGDWIVYR